MRDWLPTVIAHFSRAAAVAIVWSMVLIQTRDGSLPEQWLKFLFSYSVVWATAELVRRNQVHFGLRC